MRVDIAAVDQIIASGAIDRAIAQVNRTAGEAKAELAQGVIGLKIGPDIARQQRRIARPRQQGLQGGAVRDAHRRVTGIAIGKADRRIAQVHPEIAAAQIGQHDLKAVGAGRAIGMHAVPGDRHIAIGRVQIPIDRTALVDIDIGPERRNRRHAQRGQRPRRIAGVARAKGDDAVGADVDRAVAGAIQVHPGAEHRTDIDLDIAVVQIAAMRRRRGERRRKVLLAVARRAAQT